MLATIHGSVLWFDETLSTLRYASSVKRIKTSAVMNAEAAAHDIIAELRGEVVKLSAQLLSFQQKNSDMSQRRTPPRRKSSRAQKNRRATRTTSLGSGEAPEVDDDGHVLKRPSWLLSRLGVQNQDVLESLGIEEEDEDDALYRKAAQQKDSELEKILSQRSNLEKALSSKNKERMQLELQLKQRGKELTTMEIDLSTQNAEISDLVFALEASNTENKYLHDEISRLARRSQQDIDPDVLNPEQNMKKQVMDAFTSFEKVRALTSKAVAF